MEETLIIIPHFGKGGAERVLSRVLASFNVEEQKTITFLTLDYDLGYNVPDKIKLIKLKYKSLKFALFSIYKIVRNQKWSRIYSTLNHFNLILPLLCYNKKNCLLICRESILPITYYDSFKYFGKIILFYYSLIMKNYDLIIVQSLDMQKEVMRLGLKKTYLINNPSPNYQILNKKKKYDYIYIARWHDQKNHNLLFRFWSFINDSKNNKSNLMCVGVGDKSKYLNSKYNNINISFLSSCDDIELILNQSRYYINFSKYEGFSNALLESLSCGIPVFSLEFQGGRDELLNEKNSHVSSVKAKTATEKDFEKIYKDLLYFSDKKWDTNLIKLEADEKFNIDKIIPMYKSKLLRT
ncbi:glycosyltransferase [bacterium]|nr:glycosyltransferase [bacterium]